MEIQKIEDKKSRANTWKWIWGSLAALGFAVGFALCFVPYLQGVGVFAVKASASWITAHIGCSLLCPRDGRSHRATRAVTQLREPLHRILHSLMRLEIKTATLENGGARPDEGAEVPEPHEVRCQR